jgi:hypothetical protein
MDDSYRTMGEKRVAYIVLVGKPERDHLEIQVLVVG